MNVFDIIYKDLKIILSDKKALGIMILMPVILTTILSFALKGSFVTVESNNYKIPMAIVKKYNVDKDVEEFKNTMTNSIMGQNLKDSEIEEILENKDKLDIERILMNDFLENKEVKRIVDYTVMTETEAISALKNGDISGIVMLPENFIRDIYINFFTPFRNVIEIKVIGSSDKYFSSQIIEAIMKGFSDSVSSMIIAKNVFVESTLEKGLGVKAYEDMGIIIEDVSEGIQQDTVKIDYININEKKPVTSFGYYSVAMTTMFVLFAAGHGSRTLLEEKDNLTYQRMIVAGTSKFKIVSGKFFTVFIIALLQITIMSLYSSIVLKVNWGEPYLVMLVGLAIAFAVSGIGIMLAALTFKSGNYRMANAFETAVIQSFALIGGSFFPINILPSFLQKLSNIAPNGLALKSFIKIMMGYGLEEIMSSIVILLGVGIVFTLLGIYILSIEWRWSYVKRNEA